MGKFILNSNGKEIKLGDFVFLTGFKDEVIKKIKVTENVLPHLVDTGIITYKPDKEDIEFYVLKIMDKIGWNREKNLKEFFMNIVKILPSAFLSMVLREIAIELDKKYSDHIENSKKIYVISNLNGQIVEVNKARINNYRNFAAFRTIEDAKIACRIVRPLLKELFKKNK